MKNKNKYIPTYISSFRVLYLEFFMYLHITKVHEKRATWEEIDDWLNIWNAHIK